MYSVSEIIVVYTYTFVVLQARGEELTTRFSLCLFLIQPPSLKVVMTQFLFQVMMEM